MYKVIRNWQLTRTSGSGTVKPLFDILVFSANA